MTLSLSGAGPCRQSSGSLLVSACQPQTRPMVTLALSEGAIASILPVEVGKPVVVEDVGQRHERGEGAVLTAGNLVCRSMVSGGVSCVSFRRAGRGPGRSPATVPCGMWLCAGESTQTRPGKPVPMFTILSNGMIATLTSPGCFAAFLQGGEQVLRCRS